MNYTDEQIRDIFEQELKRFNPNGDLYIHKAVARATTLRTIDRILSNKIEKECTNCGHLFSGEGEYCELCKKDE